MLGSEDNYDVIKLPILKGIYIWKRIRLTLTVGSAFKKTQAQCTKNIHFVIKRLLQIQVKHR